MKFITGTNRNQLPLFTSSIDEAIAQDNEIRLIDLFVDSLKLSDFGFAFDFVENGRPAYHPSDLLKLFIYGYLNRMRPRSLGYPNALIYTIVSAELHSVPTNEGLKVNLKSNTELELVAELQNALAKNPS